MMTSTNLFGFFYRFHTSTYQPPYPLVTPSDSPSIKALYRLRSLKQPSERRRKVGCNWEEVGLELTYCYYMQ